MTGKRPPRGLTIADRLHRLSARDPESECILWQGSISKRTGYGSFTVKRAMRATDSAHRVAYEAFIGPLADGFTVDHTCHNADPACPGALNCTHRRCINPAHLQAVPLTENIRRANGLGDTPGELVTVSFRIPRWLRDEIKRAAGRRLSTDTAMVREALLAWLPSQKEDAA